MTDMMTAPLLLAAVPIMGALLGLVVWPQPDKLKIWSIMVAVLSLLAIIGTSGQLTVPAEGLLLVYTLPLAACASLLGQPVHRENRLAWVMTLLFLGLGLGILTSQPVIGRIALVTLFGLITLFLFWHHNPFWPKSWWGIGIYCLGTLCAGIAAIADPPVSSIASVLACATLLPLVPFHIGYMTALTRLPGSVPSFIVVLLPAIGVHGLAAVLPTVPNAVGSTITTLALVGILYGSIKALAQTSRVRLLLTYGSLSFFSMIWWFVTASRTVTPQDIVFLSATALVTSGLLISLQVVRTRYGGDVDQLAVSGLAATMPKFAVLFSILSLAAMGLPPFGVFAGFMGMFFTSPFPSFIVLLIIGIGWLAASWYILDMGQRLLFGRQRSDLRYEDLRWSEFACLLMIVLIVIALGVGPTSLFGITNHPQHAGAIMESFSWNR